MEIIRRRNHLSFTLLVVLACGGIASAQTMSAAKVSATQPSLVAAAEQQKAAAQQAVILQADEISQAEQKHEELRQLVAEGLVARMELEASELALNSLRAKLESSRQQVTDAGDMVSKLRAAEELAKSLPLPPTALVSANPRSLVRQTILRYGGSTSWSLANLGLVRNFFSATFGRSLPTSAVGQSATHNRLGYDHRHAVDVPLHPDSAEGMALLGFLQTKGIPFLAFRAAVPGVATGPHIHIGTPSHRLG